jgi:2-oxoglutarate ferredoxin oxidoreductase subunit beta
MPSVATGANLANRDLKYVGVSGDGDTASIGMGQFCHVIRRNVNMLYIVMNNGCYGLTKGQDSATADKGSIAKAGNVNSFEGIDLCSLAIELGATFVAQSFSGDKDQLIPLIKAAMAHKGFAFINCLSPCVTFNNNNGSTKSYDFVRDHNATLGKLDFVPIGGEITTEKYNTQKTISMHDGSIISLQKIDQSFDITNQTAALAALHERREKDEILTGLIYLNQNEMELNDTINTTPTPLNQLTQDDLFPGFQVLEEINASFR